MPSKRVRRKEIHYLSPSSRVGSHILINMFIHRSYDHTPTLVYSSKTNGERSLGPTLHNCKGRQAVVRFCNSGGLPAKQSFSVHLHGSASASAYGRSYSICVIIFLLKISECPLCTLSHHICSRRWLGRRYNWPRPGESIPPYLWHSFHPSDLLSFIGFSQCKDYVYPNNRAAHSWYHDHT